MKIKNNQITFNCLFYTSVSIAYISYQWYIKSLYNYIDCKNRIIMDVKLIVNKLVFPYCQRININTRRFVYRKIWSLILYAFFVISICKKSRTRWEAPCCTRKIAQDSCVIFTSSNLNKHYGNKLSLHQIDNCAWNKKESKFLSALTLNSD